jgi:uncharacterized membrane protein YdjX (TVP38/TMEM64 family)
LIKLKQKIQITLALSLFLITVGFFYFDLGKYFSLEYIKSQHEVFINYYHAHPTLCIVVYSLVYVISTGLSLPGAAILTLLAGTLWGVLMGTILVSFSSTIGATLAFWSARFILKDWVQSKLSRYLEKFNQGIKDEGGFYLFSLRIIPLFPFFIVNLVMGLTPIKTSTYFWISFWGMLPGTILYVNAGTQLAQIDSVKDILTPSLLISFLILALFPIASKKTMALLKKRNK